MSPAPATALYAAILALVFIALSARVILRRRAARVSIGAGGDAGLERRARVHANFAEYVPLALVLLLLAELSGSPAPLLHVAGIALVLGRVAHAVGLSRVPEDFRLRVAGMVATLTVILVLALALLVRGLVRGP